MLNTKFESVASPAKPALVTPPAQKGKPSPCTGEKAPRPQDPLQKQLAKMQAQLQEQGALIAQYKARASKPKPPPPNPLEQQLLAMKQQLDRQAQLLEQYARSSASNTPSPSTAAAPSRKALDKPSPKPPTPEEPSEPPQDSQGHVDVDDDSADIVTPDGTRLLSKDALRMRLKRMCEMKKTGKCWVDEATRKNYEAGGAERETLELALLETIKAIGPNAPHQQTRAP